MEDLLFLDLLPNTKQANHFVLSLGCKFTGKLNTKTVLDIGRLIKDCRALAECSDYGYIRC